LTNDLLSGRSSPLLGRPGNRFTSMSRSVMSWLTSSPNSVSNMLMDFSTFAGWDRPGMKFSLKKEKNLCVVNERRGGYRYYLLEGTVPFAEHGTAVSRIRDVYPGTWILIFTHPGSRIQKQQLKRGVKRICHTFFCSHKFHKIENYFIFEVLKKKIWANYRTFYPKNCH
jgi:hypothetical protein